MDSIWELYSGFKTNHFLFRIGFINLSLIKTGPENPKNMKGSLFALCTVVTWSVMGVVNRYCVLKFDTDILIFTSFLIFAGGVALMLIRKPVKPGNWKSGVRYSWLYTTMQMIKSFFLISTYLYISSTETSLLVNIEVVITYLLAYLFFKRKPYKGDLLGCTLILGGFILFIYTLPVPARIPTAVLLLIAATASCIRTIVVEQTSRKTPERTVREKCGISGYTMFIGGSCLLLFFFLSAGITFFFGEYLPASLFFLRYFPSMPDILNPATVLSGCMAGFFLNAGSVYFFYAALQWTQSETFMTFRVFQPLLTYGFELVAALSYPLMKPSLSPRDFFLGSIILLGSVSILLLTPKNRRAQRSKNFITE